MNGKLHHYTADTTDRTRTHIYLIILSILSAFLLACIFDKANFQPPWWLDTPSVFGFYGIYLWLFEQFLWKTKVFRFLFQIKTPNLNGKYSGNLKTSYDNFQSSKIINYTIKQSWSKILICSETDTSCSNSLTGAFALSDTLKKSLVYQYQNYPKAASTSSMNIHIGFAEFVFEDTNQITSEFFNGRGRQTFGTVTLNKN